jgi:methyl-accepting chemotaxis protein
MPKQRAIASAFDQGSVWLFILTGVASAWNTLQITYLRYVIVRPVKNMVHIFDEISTGQGDFSRDLPTTTVTSRSDYDQSTQAIRG